jgi:hypothetical protein
MRYPRQYQKQETSYGYIRKTDCAIAIQYFGYKWHKLTSPKTDFDGQPFTHILCKEGYMTSVLEPDTRVPNFTTSIGPAIELAYKVGVESINLTDKSFLRCVHNAIEEKLGQKLTDIPLPTP